MEDDHVVLSNIYIYVFIYIYIHYVEGSQEGTIWDHTLHENHPFCRFSSNVYVIDYQKVPAATLQEYEDWQM